MLETRLLDPNDDSSYEALVRSDASGIIYAAPVWRHFLTLLRPEFIPAYIGAFQRSRLVGAIPGMMINGPLGAVFNSLPFYGSNGGVLIARDTEATPVAAKLFGALHSFAAEQQIAASTVISNPFLALPELYCTLAEATATDERIGQITFLPPEKGGNVENALMAQFHQKTRNTVRKGLSNSFAIDNDTSEEAFRTLYDIHVENMSAIGGLAKPWVVFETLRRVLREGEEYQLYLARDGATVVAALLVLFYNVTAEYFTPVARADYRTTQSLSALIFHAMADSVRRGMQRWNWGGTWANQQGVYLFKSRWGTRNMPYRYYVREYAAGTSLRDASRAELLEGYPMCYVIPFGVLRT
jgi:hypothetical protein